MKDKIVLLKELVQRQGRAEHARVVAENAKREAEECDKAVTLLNIELKEQKWYGPILVRVENVVYVAQWTSGGITLNKVDQHITDIKALINDA